jgi:hypothetical protein
VQRLQFTADQITSEKVGVKVTGIAVYRIADPLLASRMLNFSFPERAQEKLADMMEELCVGAVRRLVANLTVEQCLTRRKDALSVELIREIAPVVGGSGRADDRTQRGWGVVVDTIEIQDVRVTSAAVFANMQARFRQDSERLAREAELSKVRAVKQGENNTEREVELHRVTSQTEVRRQRQVAEEEARLEKLLGDARVEEQRLAQERATRSAQIESERELQMAQLAAKAEVAARQQQAADEAALARLASEARLGQERLRAEAAQAELAAAIEAQKHAARLAVETRAVEVTLAQVNVCEARRQMAEVEARIVELEVHKQELLHQLELNHAARQREIENTLTPEVIQLAIANKLPELAMAFQQKMGEVHVTSVEGANPFGYIAAAVEGVMGLARSAGLEVPRKPSHSGGLTQSAE